MTQKAARPSASWVTWGVLGVATVALVISVTCVVVMVISRRDSRDQKWYIDRRFAALEHRMTSFIEHRDSNAKRLEKKMATLKILIDLPACGSGDSAYHPDVSNCHQFYQCYDGKVTHFTCPEYGLWTNDTGHPACLRVGDHDSNLVCGQRPYDLTEREPRLINLTIRIVDTNLTAPIDATVSGRVRQEPLYDMMVELATDNENFRFMASYHSIWWRSITCMNGVCGAGTHYWRGSVGGAPLTVGVSSYIPEDGTVVMFEYVSWA